MSKSFFIDTTLCTGCRGCQVACKQWNTSGTTGRPKGVVCHLDEMLEQYYRIRGWSADGLPTEDKLKDLGLDGM